MISAREGATIAGLILPAGFADRGLYSRANPKA